MCENNKDLENIVLFQLVFSFDYFEIFHKCVGKLKGKGAIAFRMKYIDHEESEDICAALKITPSNYWVLIHRAKLQLRESLDKNWFNEID